MSSVSAVSRILEEARAHQRKKAPCLNYFRHGAFSCWTHERQSYFFSRKGLIRSIGTGKMVVEFFSVATSVRVCRNRN